MHWRDWLGTVLVAAVLGLAELIHSHVLYASGLILVALVCVGGISFDVGRERGRRERPVKPSLSPDLTIEAGNGFPWDDPAYAPADRGADYRSNAEVLSELFKGLKQTPPPRLPEDRPAEGFSKKFLVTNKGPAAAKQCRVQVTNLSKILDLPWDHTKEARVTLVPGESNYVVLNFSGFVAEGDYPLKFRAFATGLAEPCEAAFVVRVTRGAFPQIVDS